MQRLVPLQSQLVRGTLGTELRSKFTEVVACHDVTRTVWETSSFDAGF
ncbi:hypothetical protein [Nodularia sp. NIES-3585]|nr:hypothetical protein [Nodularia sp. NIES-3585]GAX36402.1 hypothetical protein NIES3585_24320 [Nodularia sp. NIES-3585]